MRHLASRSKGVAARKTLSTLRRRAVLLMPCDDPSCPCHRWDDDVVFKNQAREPKKEARRFINDTVRNDFHRKFLQRYVK